MGFVDQHGHEYRKAMIAKTERYISLQEDMDRSAQRSQQNTSLFAKADPARHSFWKTKAYKKKLLLLED